MSDHHYQFPNWVSESNAFTEQNEEHSWIVDLPLQGQGVGLGSQAMAMEPYTFSQNVDEGVTVNPSLLMMQRGLEVAITNQEITYDGGSFDPLAHVPHSVAEMRTEVPVLSS